MLTNIYKSLHEGFQQSWFKGLFQNAALAKLLAQEEQPSTWGFFSTYLSSWWWNRLRFRSCIQTKETLVQFDAIIMSLQNLKRAGIFTEDNCNAVTTHASPANLARTLSKLQQAEILNQENFARVAAQDDPSELAYAFSNLLASALYELQQAEILTQENFARVAAQDDPSELAYVLSFLREARILNQENFVLATHASPFNLASVLSFLREARILNQENFVLATHASPVNLASALSFLWEARILNQENFVLATHASPFNLASVLSFLREARILNQENFVLATHASDENLASALSFLWEARILNQENFAALVTPNHAALVTGEACRNIWQAIPSHLLTTDNFRRLLTAAEHVNPMAELERLRDQILGVEVGTAPVDDFNPRQSTHTASVHKSISASAGRLNARYGSSLSLETKIQEIKDFVKGLADTAEHQAAKRCIERIADPHFTFTDTSGVSILQLLALSYTAIHDAANLTSSIEDAKALFVEGLYEIQRGYNIERRQGPKEGDDLPICTAGTFNKLMEKLNGIHPDVEIDYINHEGAYLKFPKLVKDHALKYLTKLDTKEASTLLGEIRTSQNLMPIWGAIESTVKTALWDEFKEAYGNNQADERFTDLFGAVEYFDCTEIVRQASDSLPTNACASKLGMFAAAASAGHQVLESEALPGVNGH